MLGGLLLWNTLRYGFSAHDEPTRMEAAAARAMRRWSAPADLRGERNPLPLNAGGAGRGAGALGRPLRLLPRQRRQGQDGDRRALYPRAPDMTLPATQSLSDGELFAIIENGVRLTGMPGWGDGTAESGLRQLDPGAFHPPPPRVTPEEIAEMEALNPASPEEIRERMAEEQFLAGGGGEAAPQTTGNHSHGH